VKRSPNNNLKLHDPLRARVKKAAQETRTASGGRSAGAVEGFVGIAPSATDPQYKHMASAFDLDPAIVDAACRNVTVRGGSIGTGGGL